MSNSVELLRKIENIVLQFSDLIGEDASLIGSELGVKSADTMQGEIDQINEENRLLQIGIVGRVKAGKSSLLNALLFGGEAVLPKAATPMTAALTVLSYGETGSAEIDFFTETDIRDIHVKAEQYEEELKRLTAIEMEKLKGASQGATEDKKAMQEKASKRALMELRQQTVLCACYDQSARMRQAGNILKAVSRIDVEEISALSKYLTDFVGADGKYMPFTKSVHIKLPLEILKDISIIDTPGLNDPVESRENRTRELLKFCDVIFVVSPSGQFISIEDMELMDRITLKSGVRELFVAASQVDTQLFGSEKQLSGGNLSQALYNITKKLGGHLRTSLLALKTRNPEVGTVFDQLIEGSSERVIYTSGISTAIHTNLKTPDQMDDGAKTAWENLRLNYPDSFSVEDGSLSEANLRLLSNMSAVHYILSNVRGKKDSILEQKQAEYLLASLRLVESFKARLASFVTEKIDKVSNSEVGELTAKKEQIGQFVGPVSNALSDSYADSIRDLESPIKAIIKKTVDAAYREAKGDVEESESTVSEEVRYEKNGVGNWLARKIWGGGYGSRTDTYTSVRSGAVREALQGFKESIESGVEASVGEFLSGWRKQLLSQILKTLRDRVEDEYIDCDLVSRSMKSVVGQLRLPTIEFDQAMPANLNARGTLKRDDAERFMEDSMDYLRQLKSSITKSGVDYVASVSNDLKTVQLADAIFGRYRDELSALEKQLQNRNLTLQELSRCANSLRKV